MDVTVIYNKETNTILQIDTVADGSVINYNPYSIGVIVGDHEIIRNSIGQLGEKAAEYFDSEITRIEKLGPAVITPEQRDATAKAILDAAYAKIATVIELPVDKAQDFVKEDLIERGKVEADSTGEIEVPIDTQK